MQCGNMESERERRKRLVTFIRNEAGQISEEGFTLNLTDLMSRPQNDTPSCLRFASGKLESKSFAPLHKLDLKIVNEPDDDNHSSSSESDPEELLDPFEETDESLETNAGGIVYSSSVVAEDDISEEYEPVSEDSNSESDAKTARVQMREDIALSNQDPSASHSRKRKWDGLIRCPRPLKKAAGCANILV